ncbi:MULTISPECIES: chorismate mutase [unclassified Bradyrhizobium]|uniref:chorismate mutase n=1 Tax=unclassified Bradyrhizobium TaxID=2631580 RepID=UPI0029162753|nr:MULTISPECIES: chorismate mutase [unclassified Bradyrhizobium]
MTDEATEGLAGGENVLDEFRSRIDLVDAELISLLSERARLAVEIGKYKKIAKLPIMQPDRVRAVLDDRVARGARAGLAPDVVRQIWSILIDEACRTQEMHGDVS